MLKPSLLIARVFLGLILLTTAIGKLLDIPGFIEVITTYKVLPKMLESFTAVFMVVLELKLAELFLLGRYLRKAAIVASAMHLGFTGWAILALLRGLDIPNCGCFGVFWARPLTWTTVLEDLFLLAVCIFIWKNSEKDF